MLYPQLLRYGRGKRSGRLTLSVHHDAFARWCADGMAALPLIISLLPERRQFGETASLATTAKYDVTLPL